MTFHRLDIKNVWIQAIRASFFMGQKHTFTFLTFLWISIAGPPFAVGETTPEILSLEQCIQRALANSPGLESAEFEREIALGKLSEAKRAYILPEAKVRVLGGPVPDVPDGSGPEANFPEVDTEFGDLGPFIQIRLDAVQPLFTFGKLSGLKRAAQFGLDAKEAQERAVRNELVRRVKKIYFGLVYLYSLKDFLEELQDRSGKARDRVEDLIKRHNPDVTDIDVMRMDVFQAETDRRLAELQGGIQFGESTLAILVAAPKGTSVTIQDKMVRFHDIALQSIEAYFKKAEVSRPELRQLNDLLGARKALLKSTRADYFPSFFIGGFYGYGWAPDRQDVHSPFLKDDFNFHSGGIGLGLEQKLTFHLTDSKHDQAKAEYLKAVADKKLALQGIEIEIRKAHADAMAKRESVKAALRGFKAGRSWVTATTLNFGVGLVPVKDLLEAFVAYSKVKVGYFDTIHDYDQALADLSKVIGEEIVALKY